MTDGHTSVRVGTNTSQWDGWVTLVMPVSGSVLRGALIVMPVLPKQIRSCFLFKTNGTTPLQHDIPFVSDPLATTATARAWLRILRKACMKMEPIQKESMRTNP